MIKIKILSAIFAMFVFTYTVPAQKNKLDEEVKAVMLNATRYMVEKVSNNGGYLWYYLPDFSRQWGEMEAYKTMIWIQDPGTVSMGHTFLDAYHATGNDYYYQAAEKAAAALIWGQSPEGGWNYMIDFAGDRSLRQWYATIGKNGWRLEEFQHYYGNCTFDDDVTSDAARFLLRMYLEKLDPKYKPALDKAIDLILESQYPLGGWPQRYPLKYDFGKNGNPDYTSFYTFNDDVIWENIHFLLQCYLTLGEERLLDSIRRGMNFYLISQHGSGGWAQQYDLELQPAGARTYEPRALLPGTTYGNAMLLLRFYELTGETKFLVRVPAAIEWLEQTRLSGYDGQTGRISHPTFVEIGTNKPIFVHRKGSNVIHGYYYHDYKQERLLGHYGGTRNVRIDRLKERHEKLKSMDPSGLAENSPLKPGIQAAGTDPQRLFDLDAPSAVEIPEQSEVKAILHSLDAEHRWLIKHAYISNPYIGDGKKTELTDQYATTHVGDETDTSPYRDTSETEYISTREYISNMKLLIQYINRKN